MQIGDENVHLVRSVMDEVFGRENFVSQITFFKTAGLAKEEMSSVTDFVLWYSKDSQNLRMRRLFASKELDNDASYNLMEFSDGRRRRMTREESGSTSAIPDDARIYRIQTFTAAGLTPSCVFPIALDGVTLSPSQGVSWKTNASGAKRLIAARRLVRVGNSLTYVRYAADFPVNPITNLWTDTASGVGMDKIYVVQTKTTVVERCLLMSTDPGDLVLDPTCGSGTTAYVAEQCGRRWITIDTSRVALALARTRLMAARYPYYLLADSPEGARREGEITCQVPSEELLRASQGDIKKGFVYKRVPHVTLKSIANNEEIDAIHAKWQDRLETVRAGLNKALKRSWPEWEVPREADAAWAESARKLHAEWWKMRRDRQKEIDDRPARRHRISLRPALRRPEARPRHRPVHRRKSFAAPRPLRRRPARHRNRRTRGEQRREFRSDDYREPEESRCTEHREERTADVWPFGALPRSLASRRR